MKITYRCKEYDYLSLINKLAAAGDFDPRILKNISDLVFLECRRLEHIVPWFLSQFMSHCTNITHLSFNEVNVDLSTELAQLIERNKRLRHVEIRSTLENWENDSLGQTNKIMGAIRNYCLLGKCTEFTLKLTGFSVSHAALFGLIVQLKAANVVNIAVSIRIYRSFRFTCNGSSRQLLMRTGVEHISADTISTELADFFTNYRDLTSVWLYAVPCLNMTAFEPLGIYSSDTLACFEVTGNGGIGALRSPMVREYLAPRCRRLRTVPEEPPRQEYIQF